MSGSSGPVANGALGVVRAALGDSPAWLVGGAPRDRALGRETFDLDVVVEGSPEAAARAIARMAGEAGGFGRAVDGGGARGEAARGESARGGSPPGGAARGGGARGGSPPGGAARGEAARGDGARGGATCFELSEEFSGWRVVARDHSWQVDVQPLRGGSLVADLQMRDFTAGAIAEPVGGGEPIDPLGGLTDISARRLRMAYAGAFADDPLRVLRLVRLAVDLEFTVDADTARAAAAAAAALTEVAGERVFMELRRILASPRAVAGLRLMASVGATAAVLPELEALRGERSEIGRQSRHRQLDVHGHTLEVLERTIALQRDPAAVLGEAPQAQPAAAMAGESGALKASGPLAGAFGKGGAASLAGPIAALLAEPLADELTRGEALRWGALLHDIAKPLTAAVASEPDGRQTITFIGHDARGAEMVREVLGRLRTSERLRAHVAALVRHHLRLGLLVHDPQPLARRAVFDYLQRTAPVEVDVTLLSIADRLAGRSQIGRGDRAEEAVAEHMRLARAMLVDALEWRAAGGAPEPLWRGDELAGALGIAPGPRLGELLRELAAARYAGEVGTREQALDHARRLVDAGTI